MKSKDSLIKLAKEHLHIFNTPLSVKDVQVTIIDNNNPSTILEREKKIYKNSIYIPDWNEALLATPGLKKDIDLTNLKCTISTSYYIQSLQKGLKPNRTSLATMPLLLTSDNKLVYALRGGQVYSGKISVCCSGLLTYSTVSNPVFHNFYDELVEELGVSQKDVISPVINGYATHSEFSGILIVFYAKLNKSFEDLVKIHTKAYNLYLSSKKAGHGELEARKAIKLAGLPNTDAWENEMLVPIDISEIDDIIQKRKIYINDKFYEVLDMGINPLIIMKIIEDKK